MSATRFDDVFVRGQRVVQRYRDRTAIEGNITARWELAPLRDLVRTAVEKFATVAAG